jgi:hypothetical protein
MAMKKRTAILALAAAGFICVGAAAAADKIALAKKQDTLGAEYNVAKESNFYFVLDVLGRKVELRVRGMVLMTWPVRSMRFWGRPEFAGTVELSRKTSLKAPERIVIKPGEEEELVKAPAAGAKTAAAIALTTANPDYDLEALELRDMPKRFSLDFDNGLHVTIKTSGGDSRGLAGAFKDAWRWYVRLPLRSLFGTRRGKSVSELELVFDNDKDAQAIYWHFFDGIKGIIL